MSASNSPSPSPSSSQRSSAVALTPTRKVQALLAGLSDSESGEDADKDKPTRTTDLAVPSSSESSGDEILPRSRIARRLAGGESTSLAQNETQSRTRSELSNQGVLQAAEQKDGSVTVTTDEDSASSSTRRRLLLKEKSSPVQHTINTSRSSRSASPMFFSSPSGSALAATSPSHVGTPKDTSSADVTGKSKFLALVEKHRKERLAKEAAETAKKDRLIKQAQEIAKRAAGTWEDEPDTPPRRGQRGSSPADDSEEDSEGSNAAVAKRLTREARPTRKASKKALEEMNRETQRISRNMQLAHQARTKKKITKESLLARFNFVASDNEADTRKTNDKSSTASSATASEAESGKDNTTPPTSPLQGSQEKNLLGGLRETHMVDLDAAHTDEDDDQFLSLEEMLTQRRLLKGKDKMHAAQHDSTLAELGGKAVEAGSLVEINPRPLRNMRALVTTTAEESDSELEVVTDKGSKRKYAAFESLPKRKAKETGSHLALRSLAHLMGSEDRKCSTNAAQMEASLRKAARQQAKEERQAKIEQLKAKGVFVQTAEEREREQQEVEDLVEKARQEAAEIQKREKELAKKDGTFVKDALDEDDDSDEEDEDFGDEEDVEEEGSDSDVEGADEDNDMESGSLIEEAAEEGSEEDDANSEGEDGNAEFEADPELDFPIETPTMSRQVRKSRVISDDEDAEENMYKDSPVQPLTSKTPQSISRSARKVIPGLQMSDDLPLGLTQAFAATMADTQSQDFACSQEQDSMDILRDLPSPYITSAPPLQRLDSIDMVSDSLPASQTQPLDVHLGFSQSQRVPESPAGRSVVASQAPFDLTQDAGYMFSPFLGSRFNQTPRKDDVSSTIDTVILPQTDDSPIMQRKGRLRRGQVVEEENEIHPQGENSAFQIMRRAAKQNALDSVFDKKKSHARVAVDEAAEESDDEYAGLGGASDDDENDVENEDDRNMIDQDTQVGKGDEAKLAQLYANRERESDEAAVSKLLKDITTGALRRKRGAGDDLDLSDEEDATARRREAKRREFARMRRELLKDEAVGRIAEDKKKEAFLRSIEDREQADGEDEDDFDQPETPLEVDSQDANALQQSKSVQDSLKDQGQTQKGVLGLVSQSQLNKLPGAQLKTTAQTNRKPTTLAEIRESVSFLIEEPDSQAGLIDLGLSDSEEEPEAYVNLDRHFKEAEADENNLDDDEEDLGDFIVDDDGNAKDSQVNSFKKPELPRKERAPFSERRTKAVNVVDRLSLIRQASSSSSASNMSTKMAFFTSKTADGSFHKVPNLLRRATTNSSLGSMSGRENVSATGVVTHRTERGDARHEKEFIRKGSGTSRNAVNYQARQSLKEEKMSARAGIHKKKPQTANRGFLTGLFRGDSWG